MPLNIIKKLLLFNKQREEINNIHKSEKILYEKQYYLVNIEWIKKYKEHYNISKVLRDIKSIEIKSKQNYEEYKSYIENIIKEKKIYNENKIELKSKFPEELKDSNFLLPQIKKYSNYEYPINFEIMNSDLFNLLIKEDDINDRYNIQLNKNNDYNIIFNGDIIILKNNENNNKNILVYQNKENNEDYKSYILQYIFSYEDISIINEEINDIKSNKGIYNYITKLDLDLYLKEENIIKKGKIIGMFINLYPNVLNVTSFEKPPLIGLANIGATCYMNATLQSFSNIDTLTNFFLTYHKTIISNKNNKYDLAKVYVNLILNLWNTKKDPKNKYYEPHDFKKRLGEKNSLFSGIAANDSKDLILFILEELHNELNNPNTNNNINENNFNAQVSNQTNEKEEYQLFKNEYYNKNNSIIQKIFYGEQESFTNCKNCGVFLYSFSIFNFLVFPLEKVRQYLINCNRMILPYVTLKDCFDQYISEEMMMGPNQMYCNYCKVMSDSSMSNIIYKHPEVLIIILNRGQGLEFNVPFQYPNYFLLNNYINKKNNVNYNNNSYINYELISVISHIGDSSMSGHFISCSKSPVDQKWYIYNDAIVSECNNPLNIFGDQSSNSIPYVLFYQLVKCLFFKFPDGKEYLVNFKDYMIFEKVSDLVFKTFNLKKEKYGYFRNNGNEIDISRTIKENNLENEEKIFVKNK